jgi:hypothetical protein
MSNTFLRILRGNKINELVVSSNNLTNNFLGLLTSGLGLEVACGQLVVLRCIR